MKADSNNRSRYIIKLEAIYRLSLLKLLPQAAFCLVNEFPKSGGSWLGDMLSAYGNIDFPRNRFPSNFPCIFHGHYLPINSVIPIVILWRDPRDVIMSWYFHNLIYNGHNNPKMVEKNLHALNFADVNNVQENLVQFMRYAFDCKLGPRFNWNDFYDNWFHRNDENILHTSYEALKLNPEKELARILEFVSFQSKNTLMMPEARRLAGVVRVHSFENKGQRKPGVENTSSFLRKGIVGDWQNYFDKESIHVFNSLVGDRLSVYTKWIGKTVVL